MRPRLAFVVLTACGGLSATPDVPRDRPGVRLVRCMPANPPPQLETIDELATDVDTDDPDADILHRPRPGSGPGGWGTARPRRGTVSLGTATATGALASDRVTEVMRSRLGELKACYDRELARSPTRAVVQWRFSIAPTGRVLFSTETSKVLGSELNSCVSRVVNGSVFPAAQSTTAVIMPIVFDTGVPGREVGTPDLSGAAAWTPFATDLGQPPAVAAVVGRATEAALRRELTTIEACFSASATTGSVRLMLRVNAVGELAGLRVGGMGDAPSERCIAKALAKLTVVTPASNLVEVACDLSRGDARPWRIAPASGYDVIEASKTQLRRGEITVPLAGEPPEPLPDAATYLILAQPDTPGTLLLHAFAWASAGIALLAVTDGAAAPPLYLGIGSTGNTEIEELDEGDVVRPVLHVGPRALTVCVNRATQQAKLRDARAIGALVQRVAAKCRSLRCASTLQIAIDNDAKARDLVEVVGAARSAGFDRVLLGGDAGCTPPATDR